MISFLQAMKRFTWPGIPSGKTIRKSLIIIAVAVGVIGSLSLTLRVARLHRTVALLSEGLGAEVERQNELAQYLESNQRTATDQLREVRRLLNLPVTEFRFPGERTVRDQKRDPAHRYLLALDRLVLHHQQRALREEVTHLFSDRGRAESFLREQGLTAGPGERSGTWAVTFRNPRPHLAPLFTLRMTGSVPPAALEITPLSGDTRRLEFRGEDDDFSDRLVETLVQATPDVLEYAGRYERSRRELRDAAETPIVREALRTHNLAIHGDMEVYPLVLTVSSSTGAPLLEARVVPGQASFQVGDTAIPGDQSRRLPDTLAEKISALDLRPEEQRAEDEALEEIRRIAGNAVFQEHLEARGLRILDVPRETLDFRLFELVDETGSRMGSFAVLKNNGEIYLLDEENVMIAGLRTLSDERAQLGSQRVSSAAEAQALPEGFPPGFRRGTGGEGTNLLLVGTHENIADAIVLIHLGTDRTISMVSIPRDIYYQGRKLSYHFEVYGARTFVRRVGDIIDLPIDGYVEIDMYAFIEVVNILGGITLTLDEPLTDPTYLVRDEGEWGTLHYPAGTHTLNGIEALRIARSRATTTDFGRSSRQQEILEALRRRINDLHAGNLDTLYQLFRVLFEYVDTDIGAWEMTQYYLAYRNAPIVTRTGLTFDNVLYATWSNVHNRGITMEEAEEMEDFFLGQWILLPRGDDWSVIPWFVEEALTLGTGANAR